MLFKPLLISLSAAMLLSGCMATGHSGDEKKLTLGLVQQHLEKGVNSLKVLETIGSPNIVKTAPNSSNEIWIYDKIYHSKSESTINLLLGGGGNGAGGAAGLSNSNSVSSSKALTVIIKFNEQDNINDISYFRSSF